MLLFGNSGRQNSKQSRVASLAVRILGFYFPSNQEGKQREWQDVIKKPQIK